MTAKELKRESNRIYRIKNKEKISQWQREYRIKNLEKKKEADKLYREKNKEKIALFQKEYYVKNRDTIKNRSAERRRNNPDLNINYFKENKEILRVRYRERNRIRMARYRENPHYKITLNLRRRLTHAIKDNAKHGSFKDIVGCTPVELKTHLQNQFLPGMTWENYGQKGWHIDHIVPCNLFDLSRPEQQKSCFNYKNLQPLWGTDNIRKRDILEVCPV